MRNCSLFIHMCEGFIIQYLNSEIATPLCPTLRISPLKNNQFFKNIFTIKILNNFRKFKNKKAISIWNYWLYRREFLGLLLFSINWHMIERIPGRVLKLFRFVDCWLFPLCCTEVSYSADDNLFLWKSCKNHQCHNAKYIDIAKLKSSRN